MSLQQPELGFVELLAPAGIWAGLVAFTLGLSFLLWTRWGATHLTGKCLALSALAHLLVGIYLATCNVVSAFNQPAAERRIIVELEPVEPLPEPIVLPRPPEGEPPEPARAQHRAQRPEDRPVATDGPETAPSQTADVSAAAALAKLDGRAAFGSPTYRAKTLETLLKSTQPARLPDDDIRRTLPLLSPYGAEEPDAAAQPPQRRLANQPTDPTGIYPTPPLPAVTSQPDRRDPTPAPLTPLAEPDSTSLPPASYVTGPAPELAGGRACAKGACSHIEIPADSLTTPARCLAREPATPALDEPGGQRRGRPGQRAG